MPSTDSPAVIVARFLKANHFTQTLEAFLQEAGLSEDKITTNSDDWTIERILEEKKQFDASLTFEKKDNGGNQGWTSPAPTIASSPEIPAISNVLSVAADSWTDQILTTHADRTLNIMSTHQPYLQANSLHDNDSPILSITRLPNDYLISTSMSGQIALHRAPTYRTLDTVRHHSKYCVSAIADTSTDDWLIATAGWDQKINIYSIEPANLSGATYESSPFLHAPVHTISLPTVPEAIIFVRHPDTNILYLIYTRRDSTFLYYHSIAPSPADSTAPSTTYTVTESGRQNLAPHSNAWVSFTPSSIARHPSDPALLAIGTSHLPHMKLVLARLLFPSPTSQFADPSYPSSQNAQARSALEVQNREENAILLHVTTFAPQTPYSTPCVVWRPDGSGVWVNGDDGVIRGLEVKTGKVVALLKGHEVGSKVRCMWSGLLPKEAGSEEKREVLISGGFDKRVIVWECDQST